MRQLQNTQTGHSYFGRKNYLLSKDLDPRIWTFVPLRKTLVLPRIETPHIDPIKRDLLLDQQLKYNFLPNERNDKPEVYNPADLIEAPDQTDGTLPTSNSYAIEAEIPSDTDPATSYLEYTIGRPRWIEDEDYWLNTKTPWFTWRKLDPDEICTRLVKVSEGISRELWKPLTDFQEKLKSFPSALITYQTDSEISAYSNLPLTPFPSVRGNIVYPSLHYSDRDNSRIEYIETETTALWDTDPMGKDADLFKVDYEIHGEAGHAVENKVSTMTQLDRLIFETGHNANGKTQRQGLNIPNIGYKFKFELLAKRLNCTNDQAIKLLDYWKIIEGSHGQSSLDLYAKFESGMIEKQTPIDKAITWFKNLADSMEEVEDWTPLYNFGDLDTPGLSEEEETETIEADETAPEWKQGLAKLWNRFTDRTETQEEIDEETSFIGYNGETYTDTPFGQVDLFRYQNINYDGPMPSLGVKYIEHNEPELFNQIIKLVDNSNLENLNAWRKLIGSKDPRAAFMLEKKEWKMRSMFWTHANSRKNILEQKRRNWVRNYTLTGTQVKLINHFKSAKSEKQASFFGSQIHRMIENNSQPINFLIHILRPALYERWNFLKENPNSNAKDESELINILTA